MLISVGKGRYSATGATEADAYARPRLLDVAPNVHPPILYSHGSTESPFHATGGVGGSVFPTMISKLVDIGRRWIFCADLGPSLQEWGSDASMARLTDLYNWAKTITGYTGTKVHLLGSSMGNDTQNRWAAQNPTKVFSITGLIPVTGVQWCRDNNSQLRTVIDSKWGVVYPAPLPAGADPFTDLTASLMGIPFLGYSASDDVGAAPLVNTNAWATLVGGESHSVGPLGHTDAAQGAPDYSYIANFMAMHES